MNIDISSVVFLSFGVIAAASFVSGFAERRLGQVVMWSALALFVLGAWNAYQHDDTICHRDGAEVECLPADQY